MCVKEGMNQVSTIIFAVRELVSGAAIYCICISQHLVLVFILAEVGGVEGGSARSDSPGPALQSPPQVEDEQPPDPELEKRLLGYLSELSLSLPTDSLAITNQLNTVRAVNVLLYSTSHTPAITIFHILEK